MRVNIAYTENEGPVADIQVIARDCWNAYRTISLVVFPLLVEYRKTTTCYPMDLTPESWSALLDEFIWAFKTVALDVALDDTMQARLDLAFMHFGLRFTSLWD